MADDYLIHLNFLALKGRVPPFMVFRKLRENQSAPAPADTRFRIYTLARDAAKPDERDQYLITLSAADGFEAFAVGPSDNNDLTKWMLFDALRRSAESALEADQYSAPVSFSREVRFTMATHPEGSEELIVEPYILKAKNTFGFLVDYHFRLAKEVPFSRRVQQLSLSLDKNFRRNLDYYVDRFSKINQFVRLRWEILSNMHPPGSDEPILLSEEFESLPADRLRSRAYVFADAKESKGQFAGLKEYGPLLTPVTSPRLLFIFREADRQAARTLAMALKGTKQKERFSFPGFESLFRVPLQIDSNPVVLPDFTRPCMEEALQRVRGASGLVLPVLVMPGDETAYLEHKSVFSHGGVPTQVVTLDVIKDDATLKWSTANIALQLFCKAGGQPWKVQPSGSAERGLIIGISQSHKKQEVNGHIRIQKHFAFSVMTDSSGLFQKIQVLGESDSEATYLDQVRENVRKLLLASAKQFSRVVIHTSFKLKRKEIEAIQRVTQDASGNPESGSTRFAVVKVNHHTRFFGANRSVNSLVPYEATRVKLGSREHLVWFEGIFPDRPTVTKAFPGPTHLQILHISDTKRVSEETLLQELVNLSGANWRGFNAKSAPVSTFYCHLVADLVHDLHERGLPLPAIEDLRPWFL